MGRRKSTAKKESKWFVALYIRLSKEDGHDVSLSVENQKQALLHYLENSEEDLKLIDIYIDDGRTGTDSDRFDFQRMLKDIEDKKVNCVIVKDLSRLSRNYAEAGLYLEQFFVENDVRFISLSLPALDSYLRPDEIGSLATAMQNIMNDDFCRQTSIKIRGIFNIKRDEGLFIGAFAPYGYLKDPENKYHLIVDENTADTVRDIFRWFLSGESKMGIAKKLNDLGILNPSEYKKSIGLNYRNPNDVHKATYWSMRTIDMILKNQMYIGDMVQGKGKIKSYKIHKHVPVPEEEWFIVPGTHEPIITSETFYKAQELLKRDTKVANNSHKLYLFSGLLRCADCGKAMHRATTGDYVYYSCRTYKERSKKACTKHTIREDRLEKAVLKAINTQLALVEDIEIMIKEIENAPSTKKVFERLNKAFEQKEKEIYKINLIRDGLYTDWKSGDITKDDYIRLRKSYDEQLEELKNSLVKLKEEINAFNGDLQLGTPYFQFFKKYQQVDKLERGLLLELIDTIYIYEGNQIEIKFKFADQQKHILALIKEYQKTKTKKFDL